MTLSRIFRVWFLGSMLGAIAVVLVWAGWIGWREWPRWRAVREMQAAVEANEPARFLDAIEQVDSLCVAEAALDEIAPLRRHTEARVRMYAVIALTVLGPRGLSQARELIDLFDDPDEDIAVRCAAASCLVLFGGEAHEAVPSLRKAMMDSDDPRQMSAVYAIKQLGENIAGRLPQVPILKKEPYGSRARFTLPNPEATAKEQVLFLVMCADIPMQGSRSAGASKTRLPATQPAEPGAEGLRDTYHQTDRETQ